MGFFVVDLGIFKELVVESSSGVDVDGEHIHFLRVFDVDTPRPAIIVEVGSRAAFHLACHVIKDEASYLTFVWCATLEVAYLGSEEPPIPFDGNV